MIKLMKQHNLFRLAGRFVYGVSNFPIRVNLPSFIMILSSCIFLIQNRAPFGYVYVSFCSWAGSLADELSPSGKPSSTH